MKHNLPADQKFLLVHVNRWIDDRYDDGVVLIGDRLVIDGDIYRPIACISLTEPKIHSQGNLTV